jgi:quercetin dioxygenase-like cupin family protein
VAQLADAKWVAADKLEPKVPRGAEVALIGADPVSTGPTTYLRTKPGYKLPLHWHIHHEYVTAISGKGVFTVDGKKIASSPGTYIVIPSRAKHDFACDGGAECVFVIRRSGPTDFNLVAK